MYIVWAKVGENKFLKFYDGLLSYQPSNSANPAQQAKSAVLVSWWLRVPYFVGFQTKQIWDLQTMLYHPAKVPSLVLTLSLDSS